MILLTGSARLGLCLIKEKKILINFIGVLNILCLVTTSKHLLYWRKFLDHVDDVDRRKLPLQCFILWNDHEFLQCCAVFCAGTRMLQSCVTNTWQLRPLVGVFGRLIQAFSDLLQQTVFNGTSATSVNFPMLITSDGRKVIPNHDVWRQSHALKTGVRN